MEGSSSESDAMFMEANRAVVAAEETEEVSSSSRDSEVREAGCAGEGERFSDRGLGGADILRDVTAILT